VVGVGRTELRQVQDELEAILTAYMDRSFWTTETLDRYVELSRREASLLRLRPLAKA